MTWRASLAVVTTILILAGPAAAQTPGGARPRSRSPGSERAAPYG